MNIFNKIKRNKNSFNKFDLSHEKKMSLNMGGIYPILCEEIIPTDKWRVNSEVFLRMAPMLAPIMHRVNIYTHYFFVPNRLVWENWEDFITGGEDGTSAPVFPTITIDESNKELFGQGSLADYFGVPSPPEDQTITQGLEISALPFRAMSLIWNEYYRDQNLIQKTGILLGDGDSSSNVGTFNLYHRAWEKDYFTSALPWPQRGAAVNLPVTYEPTYKDVSDVITDDGVPMEGTDLTVGVIEGKLFGEGGTGGQGRIENLEPEQAGTSVTINELRNATRLQEWLEKMARGGSRYAEQLKNMWNSRSSDARLQRPEYLGGGKQRMQISEVLNKAGQTEDTDPPNDQQLQPVGEMAGHGISVGKTNGFSKTFEEHGHVIALLSILPRTSYQQGLDRTWSRRDKLDYYWPDFAHLGEQEIKQKELYANWEGATENETTFGYTPRYAEYKYKQSTVHGEFKTSLKYWHMGRFFEENPALNQEFVTSDPTHDIFAVDDPTVDKIYCQIYHRISALRPMPYYGTPYL